MVKKSIFSTIAAILFVFIFSICGYCSDQENQLNPSPILLLAQADTSGQNDDALDEELLEDFDDENTGQVAISDPLYYFNYAMYSFNDVFYLGLWEPFAKGYKAVVPTPVRQGVDNFFHNLLFPVRFVNNLLQGEITDACKETGIFIVNSTVGILGLTRVAQEGLDLHTTGEDLGQTLGSYGIGNGFYIVWPFIGPSTFRDSIGLVGDSFLKPVNYVEPWEWSVGITAYDNLNATTFRIGDYQSLKEAAIDPYIAIRDAYIQNRIKKVEE